MAAFLLRLAKQTAILTPLTTKEADKEFPHCGVEQQSAFEAIKAIVTSNYCLIVIDHENLGKGEIYVTCDAIEQGMGMVLRFGKTWEGARPMVFDLV